MAIKDIITALEEQVETQRAEIISRAVRQAEQIVNDAKRQAEEAQEEQQRRLISNAQSEEARIMHQASFAKQSTLVAARESLAAEVVTAAGRGLMDLADNGPTYEPILRMLVMESWEAASSLNGDRIVLVREADRPLITKMMNEMSLKGDIETTDIEGGGVIIASADRRQRLVNTLLGRLERAKPFLAPQIAGILWPDD